MKQEGKHGAMSVVFGSLEAWMPIPCCVFLSFPRHGERHKASHRSSTELHVGACGDRRVDGDNSRTAITTVMVAMCFVVGVPRPSANTLSGSEFWVAELAAEARTETRWC